MAVRLRWLSVSQRDLLRLHAFLKAVNPDAAKRIVKMLDAAIKTLPEYPQKGLRLDDYAPREVRSLVIGDYEVRYEIAADELIILRIWHMREDR
ncbi:type II toxin-antitoxin system RelE/ParE family toxin [Asticcacaulis sp. EMRT-3]|uniref:type II toxin-antitoxin system RelE/ParE family toxin n=1 Tax=Asticcacaulis sp. EMRT-3 TaxID=3040349 RepID=UPI0024AFBF92|nr:type II toxin-antitoxin system RelE/ParE family toxin [Asticcacaulis sp. EMRT-3]MDI7773763.1 type II toxin-antitoxin system RelE/ParE family toxin [Asticcacaulis sp. EMRT-3]